MMWAWLFLVTIVCAQSANDLRWTYFPNDVHVGTQYTITYEANVVGSTSAIYLRKGSTELLTYVSTLSNTSTGGQFVWAPGNSLPPRDDYYLHLMQGSVSAFTSNIKITGGPDAVSSSATASLTQIATVTPVVLYTSTATPSGSLATSSNGLSRAGKIAIGLAIGLGVPLLAAIMGLFVLLRRLRQLNLQQSHHFLDDKNSGESSVQISELHAYSLPQELASSQPVESPHELISPSEPLPKDIAVEVRSV